MEGQKEKENRKPRKAIWYPLTRFLENPGLVKGKRKLRIKGFPGTFSSRSQGALNVLIQRKNRNLIGNSKFLEISKLIKIFESFFLFYFFIILIKAAPQICAFLSFFALALALPGSSAFIFFESSASGLNNIYSPFFSCSHFFYLKIRLSLICTFYLIISLIFLGFIPTIILAIIVYISCNNNIISDRISRFN